MFSGQKSPGSGRSRGRAAARVEIRPAGSPEVWAGAAGAPVPGSPGGAGAEVEQKSERASLSRRITRQFKSTKELLEERNRKMRLRKSRGTHVVPASLRAAHRAAEAKSSGSRYPYMLSPTDPRRLHWDFMTLLILIFISLSTPYRLAFDVEVSGLYQVVEWAVDCFFLCDVALNFRTGFIAQDGHEELEPHAVARHYMSTWLLVDILSSIPTELVADGLSGAQVLKAGKLMRIMRLLRLAKFARFVKVADVLEERFADAYLLLSGSSMKILKLTLATFVAAHMTACMWALVGRDHAGVSWIDQYEAEYDVGMQDRSSQYLASLYWSITTMTTVGYGDIFPRTDAERMVCIFTMVVGGGLFAIIIATMSSLVSQLDANTRLVNEKMEVIRSYMRKKQFPRELANRIRKYFKHYYETKTALDETVILSELSTYLQQEVALFLISDIIFEIPIFNDLHPSHLAKLLTVLKPVQCAPQDFIVQAGEEAHDMYIVMVGELEVISEGGEVVKSMHRGDFFGELAVLGVASHRNASIRAVDFCELFCLNKTDLQNAFKEAPEAVQKMRDTAVSTYEQVHNYKRDIDQGKVDAYEVTMEDLGQSVHNLDTRVDGLVSQLEKMAASQRSLEEGMEEVLALLQARVS